MAALQDVGFLRHGLLRPVSEKRMPGKRKLAGHQPHHWRAIDRNIPSLARVPALPESVFPGNVKWIRAVPKCKITIAQEPMPRKSTTLDPRIDQPGCVSMPLNSEMNLKIRVALMSRFGASHGFVASTVASAKTANPKTQL